MSNDPVLHLLGLARKAGRLELGEEPVGAVCRARQAKLVLLAADAASNTYRRAAHFGEAGNVLWLELPFTKAELGLALGRGQQLKTKADRALQRQREKRQHEKNLREGKKKPWAVPSPAKEDAPPAKKTKPARTAHGPARGAPLSGQRRDASRPARSGGPHKPGPGGRKLSGKFRHHP